MSLLYSIDMLSKEYIKEFREIYGRAPWHCKYCDVTIKDSNKPNHIKTNKHTLKKQIYRLSKK